MSPQIAVAQNLRDAGCSEDFVAEFLTALNDGTPAQRQKLLENQRRFRLQRLHDEQEKLERLDYLRYRLQKENLLLDSVYTRLSQNRKPNGDATDLDSSQE